MCVDLRNNNFSLRVHQLRLCSVALRVCFLWCEPQKEVLAFACLDTSTSAQYILPSPLSKQAYATNTTDTALCSVTWHCPKRRRICLIIRRANHLGQNETHIKPTACVSLALGYRWPKISTQRAVKPTLAAVTCLSRIRLMLPSLGLTPECRYSLFFPLWKR